MVSYEAARQFRQNANAPLTWDETVPAPPLDRIELTRRILEAAEAEGVDFPEWTAQFPFEDPEKKIVAFQKRLKKTIPKQTFSGIPMERRGWTNNGLHTLANFPLTGRRYIEQLENDYYKPWETAWRFGASSESRQNVLDLIKEGTLWHRAVDEEGRALTAPKYPAAERIQGSEVIYHYLSLHEGNHLEGYLQDVASVHVPLVERRWMGLKGDVPYFLMYAVTLSGLVAAVCGAIFRLFSGWWLIGIFPALLVAGITGSCLINKKPYWISETQTFDEWIDKIVAAKQREWAELQNTYAVS